jgi:hypothetical protein
MADKYDCVRERTVEGNAWTHQSLIEASHFLFRIVGYPNAQSVRDGQYARS